MITRVSCLVYIYLDGGVSGLGRFVVFGWRWGSGGRLGLMPKNQAVSCGLVCLNGGLGMA